MEFTNEQFSTLNFALDEWESVIQRMHTEARIKGDQSKEYEAVYEKSSIQQIRQKLRDG